MNNSLIELTTYSPAVIYTAIISVIVTSIIKPHVKKRLCSLELSEKEKTDRLGEVCFFTNLVICAMGYGITAIFTKSTFSFPAMSGFSLSALAGAELIYSVYEKIGLKNAIKNLLHIFSNK